MVRNRKKKKKKKEKENILVPLEPMVSFRLWKCAVKNSTANICKYMQTNNGFNK